MPIILPKQLILASGSPRRKELLENLGIEFTVHPSDFEEKETHITPEELALHNAIGKAQQISKHYKNAFILGADTVVAFQDHQIGKPKDQEDARRILRLLSNTTHKVITALCLIDTDNKKMISAHETTYITIDRLEESEIEAYVQSGEGIDKAGGFAIQGLGSLFIKKIEGDYFNVVGLPIFLLKMMLKKFGVKKLLT
ncbi:MAG: Maf family protein [Patescibacteria group bacterium]